MTTFVTFATPSPVSPLTADAGSRKGQGQPKVPWRDSYPDCQREGALVQRRLRVQVRHPQGIST